jgi:hypothetical protein
MISRYRLQHELQELINKYSVENASHTPDFILAEYLSTCLLAFERAVCLREKWYGRHPARGGPGFTELTPFAAQLAAQKLEEEKK